MKLANFVAMSLVGLCAVLSGLAAEQPFLDPHLEPLRPWIGKTWKGQFKNSTPEKPVIDVARWERALNGRAVRILHSINDGVYGGESIVMWDEKRQQVVFYYFTTAGFMTTGTMRFEGSKVVTHETVTGSSEGITEVRAISEITPDGAYHVKSEYLKDGKWTPGRETTYHQDPSAKVVFQ
jgi:hypothetical protein